MTKYAYEYGKRWHVETPRYSIGRFVDKQHVSTPIETIERLITETIDKSKDASRYTPAIRRECLAYAKERHQRNFVLYAYVMGGR